MKIEMKTRSDKRLEDYEYSQCVIIEIDGLEVFSVYDGDPEDSNLSRNFNPVFGIPELMLKAYLAGKHGKYFNIIRSKSDDI